METIKSLSISYVTKKWSKIALVPTTYFTDWLISFVLVQCKINTDHSEYKVMENRVNHKFSILEKMQTQDTFKKKSTIPLCPSKCFWSIKVTCIYWCLRLKSTLVPLKKQTLLNYTIKRIAASDLATAIAIKIATSNKRMTCRDFCLNHFVNYFETFSLL